MFKNYLKTASRFLKQNKVFTAINVLGLSIALATSSIILLFIVNELSYDHCHINRKHVFRVLNYYVEFNKTQSGTPFILASTLKEDFPQVQKAINTKRLRVFKLKLKEDFINIPNAIATESDVFDIFTLKLLEGHSYQKLLNDPNSIVLSRDIADKFFPGEDPIGKTIVGMINDKEQILNVNGVYENITVNSTFRAQCFVNSKWTIDDINKS
jgi:putative ABC transport system permease protein